MNSGIIYWLWLTTVFGVGSERIWEVMEHFNEPFEAFDFIMSGKADRFLSTVEKQRTRDFTLEKCGKIADLHRARGYGIICYSSLEYPPLLRHIHNPPVILYYDGNIGVFELGRIISVIGTRRPSYGSQRITERFCRDLARSGNTVASGFAMGIDITAHNAAVSAGCPTVAVLGCGLDIDYPRENFRYRDAIKRNGVFITEYPLGTSPYSGNFPKRNRILSGISSAVVVIEAGRKSGTFITSELALQQGREVFCMPPQDIYDERYAGNIIMLRDGATVVYGEEDLRDYYSNFDETLNALYKDSSQYTCEETGQELKPAAIQETVSMSELIAEAFPERLQRTEKFSKNPSVPSGRINAPKPDMSQLSQFQREIAEFISDEEKHIDIISQNFEIDTADLLVELTELELSGLIKALPGKLYGLS